MLRGIHRLDQHRLRRLRARHPGLEIHPTASTNLSRARFELESGAQVRIGARFATERLPGELRFRVGAGARLEIGDDVWMRTDLAPVVLVVFPGAEMTIGPEGFLSGCQVSAKTSVTLGRRVWIGPGSRVFDGDQHDMDADHPERLEPVEFGDYAWIASDVTVLRGVRVGEHSIVGSRSLVTRDVPPHTIAHGIPATPRGVVGDRSQVS